MNREVILQVADRIEALPPGEFDMSQPAQCIAAYVPLDPRAIYNHTRIMYAFEISETHAIYIYGLAAGLVALTADQHHAARMLRRYAETGAVDWEGTR